MHHFRKDRNIPLNMSIAATASFLSSPPSLLPQFKPRLIITTVFLPFLEQAYHGNPAQIFFFKAKEIMCAYISQTRPNLCMDFLICLVESGFVVSIYNPGLGIGGGVLGKVGVAWILPCSYFYHFPLALARSFTSTIHILPTPLTKL